MRLFLIDSQSKLVPLESSYSRNIFAHSSPLLFTITQLLSQFKLKDDSKKTVRRKHLSRCYPSPGINAGAFRTITVKLRGPGTPSLSRAVCANGRGSWFLEPSLFNAPRGIWISLLSFRCKIWVRSPSRPSRHPVLSRKPRLSYTSNNLEQRHR